jgi:hypothetical protein
LIYRYIDLNEICAGNTAGLESSEKAEALALLARGVTAMATLPTGAKRSRGSIAERAPSPILPSDNDDERLISQAKAAKLLGIATQTLRNWKSKGKFTSRHGLVESVIGERCPRIDKVVLLRSIADGSLIPKAKSVTQARKQEAA